MLEHTDVGPKSLTEGVIFLVIQPIFLTRFNQYGGEFWIVHMTYIGEDVMYHMDIDTSH